MITKKKKIYNENINKKKTYTIINAIELLKKLPKAKFNETIDLAISVKTTTKKKETNIKGYSILPNKTGNMLKTAIFLNDEEKDNIKISDSYIIFNEENIKNIKKTNINFDIIITTPKSIMKLAEIGNILGPKGLMPNIKYGTIVNDLKDTIENIKYKYIKYKTDKNNIIHTIIGKINFETQQIKENIEKLIKDIKISKTNDNKNIQIKKITINTTMGPGINININSINI